MTLHEGGVPRLILWDWNGTLLDDVAYAIGVRNRVFPRFGLPVIESLADYHAQFSFPVKDYYYRAGVTDDTFTAVAHAWMDEYVRGFKDVPMFPDALATLDAFAAAGCTQAVLSASQQAILQNQLEHAGIRARFDAVLGLKHIYATSKEAIGLAYMAQSGITASDAVMLGDTLHDAEVARALGCGCVLVARGHQSRQGLLAAGYPVADTLTEAASLLLGRKNVSP